MKTDWNQYYRKPYKTAGYSKAITGRILIRLIKRYLPDSQPLKVVELGGANSCFFELLQKKIYIAEYHVIDNNALGMELLLKRIPPEQLVFLHLKDVLEFDLKIDADVVFSVGLIEHFSPTDMERAIQAHFSLVKPGGIVLLTFPTPTVLYRFSRFISETLGMWIFHDETPLPIPRVLDVISPFGKVLHTQINWPIIFTQGIVAVQTPSTLSP